MKKCEMLSRKIPYICRFLMTEMSIFKNDFEVEVIEFYENDLQVTTFITLFISLLCMVIFSNTPKAMMHSNDLVFTFCV